MRFRLRYLHHDLELTEGPFVIGRSAACQLSLDDPLVSRRHAILVVGEEGVTIEDDQSRNGVTVNGVRLSERTSLSPGDRIVIGSQELVLLGPDHDSKSARRVNFGNKTLPKIPSLTPAEDPHPSPTIAPAAPVSLVDPETNPTLVRKAQAFALLSGVAEKALAMGRAEEAERLLAVPVSEIVDASREGKQLSPALVDTVARFAAKLAAATANGTWVDHVIELYRAQERPCPANVIDELNTAVRRVTAIDLARLRDYVAVLHQKQGTFGPAERFLVQRIDGLERLAALR
ncbi:MAG TPA: FHA domain-containing protein [Polyangiaceae bacterium]|nr:FHA domain-containing protein [Polyangiaceae bacterium]